MHDILSPQDLAQQTANDIVKNLNLESSEDILGAIQQHYEILNKTQELQIEFLSGFVANLKKLHQKDKASLDTLKQQVLSHVLKNK